MTAAREARARRAIVANETEKAAFREVFGTASGVVAMDWLTRNCFVMVSPFVEGKPDMTAFNCGVQSLAKQMIAMAHGRPLTAVEVDDLVRRAATPYDPHEAMRKAMEEQE